MDLWTDFLDFMAGLLSPVAVYPVSAFFIVLVGLGVTVVSVLATRKFTDVEQLKEDMQTVKEWREKFNEARKTMDPILLEQVMDQQQRMLAIQSRMMTSRCKPMLVYYIPFLIIYYTLANLYGASPVAIIPFNIHELLPFLQGWIGVNVESAGFGLYFWAWYILSVFIGSPIRKAAGIDVM